MVRQVEFIGFLGCSIGFLRFVEISKIWHISHIIFLNCLSFYFLPNVCMFVHPSIVDLPFCLCYNILPGNMFSSYEVFKIISNWWHNLLYTSCNFKLLLNHLFYVTSIWISAWFKFLIFLFFVCGYFTRIIYIMIIGKPRQLFYIS